jgi:hypothetical protein
VQQPSLDGWLRSIGIRKWQTHHIRPQASATLADTAPGLSEMNRRPGGIRGDGNGRENANFAHPRRQPATTAIYHCPQRNGSRGIAHCGYSRPDGPQREHIFRIATGGGRGLQAPPLRLGPASADSPGRPPAAAAPACFHMHRIPPLGQAQFV